MCYAVGEHVYYTYIRFLNVFIIRACVCLDCVVHACHAYDKHTRIHDIDVLVINACVL